MTLLEKLNIDDRFANGIGACITEIREGYARAEMDVEERHLNGGGVCQGGAIYTLADLSFAAVANSRGTLTLGISNTITFLHSANLGDHLIAECEETLDHHKLPYCDIKVKNQQGNLVAVMTGLAYRLKKEFDFEKLM
ncbi:MAG: hotdog fold thioesterase [Prevotellaceae bacterium]|nr:hotdog fold thioesterase [Candidatus Minthosoma caballi]